MRERGSGGREERKTRSEGDRRHERRARKREVARKIKNSGVSGMRERGTEDTNSKRGREK